MPTKLPKYVRLASHLTQGTQVDLDTGWGISGRDVRGVPDDDAVRAFVRNGLNRGVFEESSKAEWDEVHEGDFDPDDTPVVRMITDTSLPENKLRHALKQKRQAIDARHAERDAENDPEDTEGLEEGDYRLLSNGELQAELSARGLATGGNKGQMVTRLQKDDEANANDGSGDDGEDD